MHCKSLRDLLADAINPRINGPIVHFRQLRVLYLHFQHRERRSFAMVCVNSNSAPIITMLLFLLSYGSKETSGSGASRSTNLSSQPATPQALPPSYNEQAPDHLDLLPAKVSLLQNNDL